mmetsp:Transcript_64925/g.205101  ORF Transcript_64925/g.205101 Transcript_64925/m.205101 type:complete len:876 (+) Transcript_64925:333-2960(+)
MHAERSSSRLVQGREGSSADRAGDDAKSRGKLSVDLARRECQSAPYGVLVSSVHLCNLRRPHGAPGSVAAGSPYTVDRNEPPVNPKKKPTPGTEITASMSQRRQAAKHSPLKAHASVGDLFYEQAPDSFLKSAFSRERRVSDTVTPVMPRKLYDQDAGYHTHGPNTMGRTPVEWRPATSLGYNFPLLPSSRSEVLAATWAAPGSVGGARDFRLRAKARPQSELMQSLEHSVDALQGRIVGLERLADAVEYGRGREHGRSKSAMGVLGGPASVRDRLGPVKETSYLTIYGGLPIEGTLAARTNLEGPLRTKLREMDRIMTNMNNLLGDDVITKRNAAAVKIQALVRGHIARLQMDKAVFAARTWRRHEFAQMRSLLLDWVRWREVVELKIKAVRASNSRLLMKEITTRWRDMAMGMLPVRAEQEKRAAEVRRHHLRAWVRTRLRLWCAVAFSDRSRRAVEARYRARIAAARKKLERMAAHTGWEGAISWEMIQRQLESDAEATISSNRIRYVKIRFMDGWRRLASLRSIIKGKYMSSDRQRTQTLLLRCLNAWWNVLEEKKERWELKGMHWSRRKVWVRGRRYGRGRFLRRYLDMWRGRSNQQQKLRAFVDFMGAKTISGVFKAYREEAHRQRRIKREAIAQWTDVGRVSRAEPLRTWKEYTLAGRIRKRAQQRCIQHMVWRNRRRLVMRCLMAWVRAALADGGCEDESGLARELQDKSMQLEAMAMQHFKERRDLESRVSGVQEELAASQRQVVALAAAAAPEEAPSAARRGSAGRLKPKAGASKKSLAPSRTERELMAARAQNKVTSLMLENARASAVAVQEAMFYTPPAEGGSAADGQLREVVSSLAALADKLAQLSEADKGAEGEAVHLDTP